MEVTIIDFNSKYTKDFYNLNAAWLEKYFYIEPYDKKVLSNPMEYIIKSGGYIFLAKHQNIIVGVVSLINQKTFFELSKMAVHPDYQGYKIGLQLVNYCIDFAKKKNWKSITLYSNRKLEAAINLYTKVGFKEVSLEQNSHYKRADIKMIFEL